MKYWLPPGVKVSQQFNSVTLYFHNETQAQQFCDWLTWLDTAPSGMEILIDRPEEKVKQ